MVQRDLRRLGGALAQRCEQVCERVAVLTEESGRQAGGEIGRRAAAASRDATSVFALWLAGGCAGSRGDLARECAQAFAGLAETRMAPLSETTERCLIWRDAASRIVHETAAELQLHPHARARAIVGLRAALNAVLLRVCESFETAHAIAERKLSFAASHDAVTGLPLRGAIAAEIEGMLARPTSTADPAVCVLLLDLDNFGAINDSLGYADGDELLRQGAQRLRAGLPADAMVGRLGGDEFLVALTQPDRAHAMSTAERLRALLGQPYLLPGRDQGPLTLTASAGVATGETAGGAEALLAHAATAMHRAKLDGRDRAVCFEPQMHTQAHGSVKMEMQLREALVHGQLRLHYQPVFELSDPVRPTGLEALLRWAHPQRGLLAPAAFMATLEQTGLIVDADRWTLSQACRQAAAWHAAGLPVNVGVNISARHLNAGTLTEDVQTALTASGLPPRSLVIEVTETGAMVDIARSTRELGTLKQAGVRVAIDDFGTGYSSLAHLRRLPIDTLKVDRSFVTGACKDSTAETLLRTIAQLGASLDMITLAEGIETIRELEMLRSIGHQRGQGFLLSRPLEPDDVEPFLRAATAKPLTGVSAA